MIRNQFKEKIILEYAVNDKDIIEKVISKRFHKPLSSWHIECDKLYQRNIRLKNKKLKIYNTELLTIISAAMVVRPLLITYIKKKSFAVGRVSSAMNPRIARVIFRIVTIKVSLSIFSKPARSVPGNSKFGIVVPTYT